MDRFGPLVTARQMLGERFADLRADILEIWVRWNEADDGRLVLPQEYLLGPSSGSEGRAKPSLQSAAL